MIAAAKRWRDRTQRWVPPDRVFDARRHSADVVKQPRAKGFVVQHHYHGTFPADRLNAGLFGAGAQLLGVATFSVPVTNAVLAKHTGPLAPVACELGRFVLAPDVGFNGETWLLARAFRFVLEEKGIEAVVSFADPLEWRAGALVIKHAHYGTIYQAANAFYVGRATPRTVWIAPDGRRLNGRALQKLRTCEKGHEYIARQLVAGGAPDRAFGEEPADWLRRLKSAEVLRSERHPGNHTYVFGLTDRARRILAELHPNRPAYPKRAPNRCCAEGLVCQ